MAIKEGNEKTIKHLFLLLLINLVQIPGYQWSKKALLYSPETNETQVDRIEVFDH
jgi:hypothetical protein